MSFDIYYENLLFIYYYFLFFCKLLIIKYYIISVGKLGNIYLYIYVYMVENIITYEIVESNNKQLI